MDLNLAQPRAAHEALSEGINHAALENDGPKAFGDRMGTPAADEKVLWKGRPALGLFARTAFHTHTLGLYFAGLVVIALVTGRNEVAMVAAVLGVALLGLLYFLAWLSTRTTLYILTDARLIMRIGMAIETRINLPLKQITAAHLRNRGDDHGDIALELTGDRLLGTVLLWPHMRPWHHARPQPMLRAVPDAAGLARMIAEARGHYGAIEQHVSASAGAVPAASRGQMIPAHRESNPAFEGVPA